MKQICLPNAIQLQDSVCLNNISVPSFLMDNLHHDSVPSLRQSEVNISVNIGATHSATVDINLENLSFPQSEQNTNAVEHSVYNKDSENNFSLKVDVTTNHYNSRIESHNDKEDCNQRQHNGDHEASVVCSQQRSIQFTRSPDHFTDLVRDSHPKTDKQTLNVTNVVEEVIQLASEIHVQQSSLKETSKNIESYDSKTSRLPNTRAVTFKPRNIFR